MLIYLEIENESVGIHDQKPDALHTRVGWIKLRDFCSIVLSNYALEFGNLIAMPIEYVFELAFITTQINTLEILMT